MAESKQAKTVYLGTGRRKTAVARVRLSEGSGKLSINGRPLENYFTEDKDRSAVLGPLNLTEMRNRLDVEVSVQGGGFTGQAGAICQGIARALKTMFSPPAARRDNVFGKTTVVRSLKRPGAPAPVPAPTLDGEAGEPPAEIGMEKKLRDSGYLTRDGRMKERKKYGRKGARRSFQFSKR